MSSRRLILTNMPVRHHEMLVCVIHGKENGKPEDFFLYPPADGQPVPGEIYVGRIDRMHRQTDGAFVRLSGRQMVYLPVKGNTGCDYYSMKTHREEGARLREGDELLLQIDVNAQKTKLPRADGELNLPGRYLAFTTRDPGWHVSRKLKTEEKDRILAVFSAQNCEPEDFGVIVRTNAAQAEDEALISEFYSLQEQLRQILQSGRISAAGTCLYRPPALWAHLLDRIPCTPDTVIESDHPELLDQVRRMFAKEAEQPVYKLYQEQKLPLWQMYGLGKVLEQLTAKRVWLKSGASVIIEPTEAFVAVDVNSGKYSGKLSREEAARKINLEAAPEILRQIRLRQLSGTILIDFINMKEGGHIQELMQCLKDNAAEDPVKTTIVDMTALGIVEATREKRYPPLTEQIV